MKDYEGVKLQRKLLADDEVEVCEGPGGYGEEYENCDRWDDPCIGGSPPEVGFDDILLQGVKSLRDEDHGYNEER